jgi:hypothetical protein
VRALTVKYGKLNVDIEWRGHPNWLPLHIRFLNRLH